MLIKRDLYQSLLQHLSAKEITLLIGARQVGKTTLLKALRDQLAKDQRPVLFFNLDVEADARHFSSQEKLLGKIALEIGTQSAFIFIDEIQRKTNAGLFLKGLYDQDLPYKFIVSGSGSLELKEKIHESLAGRKRIFELFPVTFPEFFHYKTAYRYAGKMEDFLVIEPEKRDLLLLEYLNYGGYPRVIIATGLQEKINLLQEIFQSYLEKDISDLLGLEKSNAFILLIKLLADRIGNLINYSGLAMETGLSQPTLKKYIWYAEKTFVLQTIVPYFSNASKELTKSPQAYFNDLGLRNFSLNQNGQFSEWLLMGQLFKNFVFTLLATQTTTGLRQIKYWRTKDKAEVDFIIDEGHRVIPVEVKSKNLKKNALARSMQSFIKNYQPEEAWIVNLSYEQEIMQDNTTIKFLPWYRLLT